MISDLKKEVKDMYTPISSLPIHKRLWLDMVGSLSEYIVTGNKDGNTFVVTSTILSDKKGGMYFVKFGRPDYGRTPTLLKMFFGLVGVIMWGAVVLSFIKK